MRTETITRNIYTFDELSEEAKDKARNWWISCACDDEWWEFTLEDAKRVGLKIASFDTSRRYDIEGDFITSSVDCAEKILKEHGEGCGTWAEANAFLKNRGDFMDKAEKENKADEMGDFYDMETLEGLEEMERDFLKSLLEEWLLMLRKEEEWYFSNDHVDECILINEYEFTEEGELA